MSHLPGPIGRAAQARRAAARDAGLGQAEPAEALHRPFPRPALRRAAPAAAPDGDVATAVESGQDSRKKGNPMKWVAIGAVVVILGRRRATVRLPVFQRMAGQTQRGSQAGQRRRRTTSRSAAARKPPAPPPAPERTARAPRPCGRSTWSRRTSRTGKANGSISGTNFMVENGPVQLAQYSYDCSKAPPSRPTRVPDLSCI